MADQSERSKAPGMVQEELYVRKDPNAICEECPYYDQPYVPGEGPERASVAIIGEAPGHNEGHKGRPFVGISGKVLDSVLRSHGIRRSECFLDNTVACKPTGSGPPSKEAIACCSGRLRESIGNATTIVALGNTAASAILGRKTKITKDRIGPPKQSGLYPDARVIPTIHPAACLRASDNFPHLVTDLGKVRNPVTIKWEPPKYKVFDDAQRAKIALTQLVQRNGPITLDLETGTDKDEDFTHPKRLLCAGIGYEPGKVAVIGRKALRQASIRQLLADYLKQKKIICQNGKFDLQVLHRLGIVSTKLWWDTMLASYSLDERSGTHSLDYLGQEMLGTPNWKGVMKPYKDYTDAPPDVLYKYNAYDAAVTYDLYELQQKTMDEADHRVHNLLVRASNALTYIEAKGLRVDRSILAQLDEEMGKSLALRKDDIQSIVQDDLHRDEDLQRLSSKTGFNPNSPQQVKAWLHIMGYRTDTTDADTLTFLSEAGLPLDKVKEEDLFAIKKFARLMLEQRKEGKLHGTYVKGFIERADLDRIHTTILLHGTTTGRTSSRNPNLQNVPRGSTIRRLFVPDDGNVYIQADYAGIEYRVVATLAHAESLRNLLAAGRDIHSEVAAQFFGQDFTKEQRVKAKSIVHGLNYGRTEVGLSEDPDLNISKTDAKKFINTYFDMFPEVKAWHQQIKDTVFHSDDHLQTPFGRKRRFMLITRDNKEDIFKEALAFQPQSIASDINLIATCELHDAGIDVRLPVHDSILAECPKDEAEEVGRFMSRTMENVALEHFTDYVPFAVDVEQGPNWGALA